MALKVSTCDAITYEELVYMSRKHGIEVGNVSDVHAVKMKTSASKIKYLSYKALKEDYRSR